MHDPLSAEFPDKRLLNRTTPWCTVQSRWWSWGPAHATAADVRKHLPPWSAWQSQKVDEETQQAKGLRQADIGCDADLGAGAVRKGGTIRCPLFACLLPGGIGRDHPRSNRNVVP